MSEARDRKNERVQVRLDAEAKRVLERAAALSNVTLSSFVVSSALDAATRVIEQRERVILDTRDWDTFMRALDNPPEPNDALKDAFARHREATA